MPSKFTRWWRELQRVRTIRSASLVAERQCSIATEHTLPERPRILLLKLDHLGDFVVGMRAMLHIRKAWPDAHLTLVCAPSNVTLAQQLGVFDRIVPYRFFPDAPHEPHADAANRCCGFSDLDLGGPFDLAIDMRYDGDTRPLLDLVNARFRAGYAARNRTRPLDLQLPATPQVFYLKLPSSAVHAELRLSLLASAVIETFGQRSRHPIESIASARAVDHALAQRPYIVVATGARKATCKWPIANFVALCAALADKRDHDIVVIGLKNDSADGRAVEQALPPGRVHNTTGQMRIDELPALVANASLYIGNDTGPTHIAAKLAVPTLCIFSGVADHEVWQPRGPNVRLIRTAIGCSPCYIDREEQCPVGVKCLKLIAVDDVLTIALAMLDEADSKRPAVAGD
jgi:ADP-heptose:LPS heptosyltransferase